MGAGLPALRPCNNVFLAGFHIRQVWWAPPLRSLLPHAIHPPCSPCPPPSLPLPRARARARCLTLSRALWARRAAYPPFSPPAAGMPLRSLWSNLHGHGSCTVRALARRLCAARADLLGKRVAGGGPSVVSRAGVAPSLAFTAAALESERRRGLHNGLLTRAADVVFVPVAALALCFTTEGFNLICFLVASSLLAQVLILPACAHTPRSAAAQPAKRARAALSPAVTTSLRGVNTRKRMNQTLKKLLARPRPPREWSEAFRHRGYYFDVRGLTVNEGASVGALASRAPASPLARVYTCTQEVIEGTRERERERERKGRREGEGGRERERGHQQSELRPVLPSI